MRDGKTFARSVQRSFLATRNVETDLHRTPETFLSRIHCRFSLATLFPASLPRRTFSCLPGITIRRESFRGRFDRQRFASFRSPRGLISINCGATSPPPSRTATRSILQGGNSARRMWGYEPPFSPETT